MQHVVDPAGLSPAGLRAVAEYRKTQFANQINQANRFGGACMWIILMMELAARRMPGDFGNPEKAALIDKAEELRQVFKQVDKELPGIKGPT